MGDLPGSPSVAHSPPFCAAFCNVGLLVYRFIMGARERRDRRSIRGGRGERSGGKRRLALRLLRGKFENGVFSLVGSQGRDHSATAATHFAAVGDESRTVRIAAADMTRGEWGKRCGSYALP